ncbi:MAG: DNA-binding protein WhiA [Niameybacter sp.]|uniref:DNA-binding protein WhiA n=1 Tax=Niameybacter sp. TaxID=2033640 RepID=UPI002FC95CA0
MSFSSDVRKELTDITGDARHCMIAEIGAFLLMAGKIEYEREFFNIRIHTENEAIARKYFTMIKKTFNINTEVILMTHKNKSRQTYLLQTLNTEDAKKILLATTILKYEGDLPVLRQHMDYMLVQSMCCKRAYLRGSFLGGGSVSDPEKGYHFEFVTLYFENAEYLQNTMNHLEMDAKIVTRKGSYVVYLKEGSQIVDLLNVIGAHIALMQLENIRIVKEVRNNVNRLVNCETANLKKTVSAAVRQVQDIEYLRDTIGLAALPENLEQIARFRLEYSSATLKELGELLMPPVGKSGVNHRLKKLSEIADQIREQRGGKIK